MSEEIAAADALLIEIARLRTDLHERESQLGQAHQALAVAEANTAAERDARSRYEIIVLAARRFVREPNRFNQIGLEAALDMHDRKQEATTP